MDFSTTNNDSLEKAVEEQTSIIHLIVFIAEASEIFNESFSQFCCEQIRLTVMKKKLSFILCLSYTANRVAERLTKKIRRTIFTPMKKVTKILQADLKNTHWILKTDHSFRKLHN